MARRSPTNARYQKNTEPAGKTKRSAASVKPKRGMGGAAPAKKKPARKSFRDAWRDSAPTTPEIKRWTRIWLGLLGAAIAVLGVVYLVPAVRAAPALQWAGLGLYVVLLGVAFWVQMFKIRVLRERAKAARKKDGKA